MLWRRTVEIFKGKKKKNKIRIFKVVNIPFFFCLFLIFIQLYTVEESLGHEAKP